MINSWCTSLYESVMVSPMEGFPSCVVEEITQRQGLSFHELLVGVLYECTDCVQIYPNADFSWTAYDHQITIGGTGNHVGYVQRGELLVFLGALQKSQTYDRFDFLCSLGHVVLQRYRGAKDGLRFTPVVT